MNNYDYIVFIGRFQPFHNGHKTIVDRALELASKKVIILVGSINKPRSFKNPFDAELRSEMIMQSIPDHLGEKVRIEYVADSAYNDDAWIKNVQSAVSRAIALDGWTDYPPKVAIIGHKKDTSSFYLDFFPQWKTIDIEPAESVRDIHATDIREQFLFSRTAAKMNFLKGVVSPAVYSILEDFRTRPEWEELVDELEFVRKYKKSWEVAPYAPIFVTSDAVVIQDGHVLMVKRGANPGKGLWALPGGFVNQNERVREASIRELIEETKIKVPEKVLRRSIVAEHVFDHPDRSFRGRTITHAAYFKLDSVGELPKVKGSDDAAHAEWIPLSKFDQMEKEIFEDHYHVVRFFVGE